ncbi:hypothetical protein [Pseudonocardia sp. DSM 110487]|uniref:NAD(P)-binding protein n=1 Tax=Pseudonocardia sp. DSM 110487 TaxID=2865833 RepID=UPI00210712F8|nr:hypothetical protein [Pseudonocardia sp. DSM 110487]
MPAQATTHRVVVVGGGYAGTLAANRLRKRDNVDVTLLNPRPVNTVTPHACVTWPLEWRSQAHPALSDIIGHAAVQIDVTEHLFTTRRVDQPTDIHSVWLTSGIWLQTAQSGLHIFNALDENGLSNEPPLTSPELRHFPI